MIYPKEFITAILNAKANNISKLATKHSSLIFESGYYVCKCPFHKGEKADFFIDIKKNVWSCPVCGETGNAISFVMKERDYSFDDAVKVLAKRAHIDMPSITTEAVVTPDPAYYEINAAAARYYHDLLLNNAPAGEKYFADRGLSLETILKFRLGCAPSFGDSLYKHLKTFGYADDLLIKSGLIGISADGRIYDKFRDRVMFPIANIDNKIIGFGGRILVKDKNKPKYLNSPATPVFDKKKNLYGFNLAKKTNDDYYIFCEGYMDVITLHQAGFTNAVASLGTALTVEQVALISEYTDKVMLAYDSDAPGVNAGIRAFELFEKAGIECRVIDLSDCKDPDEFIKKYGKKEFHNRILKAEDGLHFKYRKLKEKEEPQAFYDLAAKQLLKEEKFI